MRNTSSIARSTALIAAFFAAGCHDTTAPRATIIPVPALTAQNSSIGFPTGWIGTLGQPVSFIVGVESANAHGGTHAAFLTNADSVESGAATTNIAQLVRANAYAGHRVRWSGWVRSTNVELPYASLIAATRQLPLSGLWMRVDGTDSTLAFDNMQLFPVLGTTDWHLVSIVLDVPARAVGIIFGVIFSGTGQLLADDLSLDIVDTSVSTTNILNPSALANVGLAYQNAPAAPTNLDFETLNQSSTSLRPWTPSTAGLNVVTVSSGRRAQ